MVQEKKNKDLSVNRDILPSRVLETDIRNNKINLAYSCQPSAVEHRTQSMPMGRYGSSKSGAVQFLWDKQSYLFSEYKTIWMGRPKDWWWMKLNQWSWTFLYTGLIWPTPEGETTEGLVNRSFGVDYSETHTHVYLYIYIWMAYFRTI